MEMSKGKTRNEERKSCGGEIITGMKLGIKEKRQEKEEEEGCVERNVRIGNKWCWQLEVSKIHKRKQRRMYAFGRGLQREE
jgi:hypothetical protein